MTLIESIDTTRLIKRSHAEPVRSKLSWHETWEGPDSGLIKNWEIGRKLAIQNPDLAAQTRAGELPPLNWKGGSDRTLVKREKFGSLRYLAQWQGLRGEDLSIDMDAEVTFKCPNTQTHIETMSSGVIPRNYALQMQWQMACTLVPTEHHMPYLSGAGNLWVHDVRKKTRRTDRPLAASLMGGVLTG